MKPFDDPYKRYASLVYGKPTTGRFEMVKNTEERRYWLGRRCGKQSARKHRKRGDIVVRHDGAFYWRPRPLQQTMTYIGQIEHLKSKTALVRPAKDHWVLAQFDDRQASLTGEPVRTDASPPTFALGYSWHNFPAKDFQ